METKANYTLVGLFVIIVTVAAFGFIYWYAELSNTGQYAKIVVKVPGSAAGLNVGSPVRFNGIPVGQVRKVNLDYSEPQYVRAELDVSVDTPLNDSSIIKLEAQGLTGSALFEISTPTGVRGNLLREAFETGQAIEMEAQASGIASLLETAEKVMTRTDAIVSQVEDFVTEVQDPIKSTLDNAETFSSALTENAQGIDEFLKSVSGLTGTIQTLSVRIDSTLASADRLVSSIDPEKINSTVTNFEKLSADATVSLSRVDKLLAEIEPDQIGSTVENISQASADAQEVLARLNGATEKVDKLLTEVDPALIRQTLNDIAAAGTDARETLAEARTVVSSVGGRSDDIDQMITDISQIASRLNAASVRVDGVLAKLDGFLGDSDSSSLMADAQETLKAFKEMANNLNARIGPITANLERFSGSGLKDVEALVVETRRSISRIERSISSIERDPQRLLFGGETVKQFDGRTRR